MRPLSLVYTGFGQGYPRIREKTTHAMMQMAAVVIHKLLRFKSSLLMVRKVRTSPEMRNIKIAVTTLTQVIPAHEQIRNSKNKKASKIMAIVIYRSICLYRLFDFFMESLRSFFFISHLRKKCKHFSSGVIFLWKYLHEWKTNDIIQKNIRMGNIYGRTAIPP